MFRRPDAAMRIAVLVVTLVSMGFTGFFGWIAGGGYIFFSIVGAVGLATISALSPLLWSRVAVMQAKGNGLAAGVLACFAMLFLVTDALTNIGSVFAMRETEIVGVKNTNENAHNARDQVERIKKRMADIRGQTTWQTDYLSPEAYDYEIAALQNETERGRNIYQRSKQCSDTTVKSSQRVCQAIASAQANKANATKRLELKAEMVQLQEELTQAKADVVDTPTVVSAAMTQVEKLTSLATLTLNPDADQQETGYLIITGLLGIVMAIAPAIGAWALGLTPAPAAPGAPVSRAPYIANHTHHQSNPVPGHYSSNTETTYVIEGGTVTGDSLAHLRALRERVQARMAEVAA